MGTNGAGDRPNAAPNTTPKSTSLASPKASGALGAASADPADFRTTVLVTITEFNEKTRRNEIIVSHGVDLDTGREVVLPNETPEYLGGVFDPNMGEYVVRHPRVHKDQLGLSSQAGSTVVARANPAQSTNIGDDRLDLNGFPNWNLPPRATAAPAAPTSGIQSDGLEPVKVNAAPPLSAPKSSAKPTDLVSADIPHLLVVDGLGVVRRIFEAMPEDDSPQKAQGCLASAWGSFMRAVRDNNPTHFLAAFDFGGRTFRNDIFADYKAGRSPMCEHLRAALPDFIERLKTAGLPALRIQGVEADDVMATVSTKSRERGFKVTVLTNDKDMLRLIDFGVQIKDHFTGEQRDEAYVEKRLGVPSKLVSDALALIGDVSDNIPGVKNVGVITASKLLRVYGSFDAVMAAAAAAQDGTSPGGIPPGATILSRMSDALSKKLMANEHAAHMSMKLASLMMNVRLGVGPQDLKLTQKTLDIAQNESAVNYSKGTQHKVSATDSSSGHLVTEPVGQVDKVEKVAGPVDAYEFPSEGLVTISAKNILSSVRAANEAAQMVPREVAMAARPPARRRPY